MSVLRIVVEQALMNAHQRIYQTQEKHQIW